MERILAHAVVDKIELSVVNGSGMCPWRVEVWGEPPHDYVRIYTITAKSDTLAAQEGLRRFEDEIAQLIAENQNGDDTGPVT